MEAKEQINLLKKIISDYMDRGFRAVYASAKEFFRVHVGEKSSFYRQLDHLKKASPLLLQARTLDIMNSYISYIGNGLASNLNTKRRIQTDTILNYLKQAETILATRSFHPATACVIIAASLEELLRAWIEAENLSLGNAKPSLNAYAKALKQHELINMQEYKNILSWSGMRNNAARGDWEQVSDKNKIEIMLQGVNFFIKQHSKG